MIIMPLSAGARLGPYEILASIGKGGMRRPPVKHRFGNEIK